MALVNRPIAHLMAVAIAPPATVIAAISAVS
jgi:hypothetical protein